MIKLKGKKYLIFGALVFASLASPLVCMGQSSMLGQSQELKLYYSRQVPSQYRDLLESDVVLLKSLGLRDTDGAMTRIMKLPEFNNQNVEAWIARRAHYIVDEDFEVTHANLKLIKDGVIYPKPKEVSSIFKKSTQTQDAVKVMVNMTNLGGLIYSAGKVAKQFIGIKIDGLGVIPVSTSQVGIFQIGAGLFSNLGLEDLGLESFFQQVRRLKTLFHEARHGDGNGEMILFAHSLCPKNHAYQGHYGCDQAANGAYRISSLFLRAAIQGCKGCDSRQIDILKIIYADDLSRIMSPLEPGRAVEYDDTPEVLVL